MLQLWNKWASKSELFCSQDVAVEGGRGNYRGVREAGMQGIPTTSVIKGVLEQTCQPWIKGKDSLVQARMK